jgi:nucleoside-diphosphate-sugar epimerase
MKIAVTGAGGFLGAAVCAAALRAGHEVVATARQPDPDRLKPLGDAIARRTLDVLDSSAVEAMLSDERPNVVIHSAWAGLTREQRNGPGQLLQLEACCRLVQAAGRCGVRKVVGIGSQAEYGPTPGRTGEETLPQPNTLYGVTKLAAGLIGRQLAATAGIDFAWLRLFAVYGPGDNANWLIPSTIAALASADAPRLTPGTQYVDYLYIDDAAAAVLAVATNAEANGIFNLASGTAVPVGTIVERLRDLVRPGLNLTFGEIPFAADQPLHIEGAIDRLRQATGWEPTISIERGLELTVERLRGH